MDHELANHIAERCVALHPELSNGMGVKGLNITQNIVGLRPSRKGGARVEIEKFDAGLVVHNYGRLR